MGHWNKNLKSNVNYCKLTFKQRKFQRNTRKRIIWIFLTRIPNKFKIFHHYFLLHSLDWMIIQTLTLFNLENLIENKCIGLQSIWWSLIKSFEEMMSPMHQMQLTGLLHKALILFNIFLLQIIEDSKYKWKNMESNRI